VVMRLEIGSGSSVVMMDCLRGKKE